MNEQNSFATESFDFCAGLSGDTAAANDRDECSVGTHYYTSFLNVSSFRLNADLRILQPSQLFLFFWITGTVNFYRFDLFPYL